MGVLAALTRMQNKRTLFGKGGTRIRFDLTAATLEIGRETFPLASTAVVLAQPDGTRITATRLVTLGVFAVAARKRTDPVLLVQCLDGRTAEVEVSAVTREPLRAMVAKVDAWHAERGAMQG